MTIGHGRLSGMDDAADHSDIVIRTETRTNYPDSVKQSAYEAWAFKCGGNCARVSALLKTYDPPLDVNERAIQRWAKDHNWPQRRYNDWHDIAPDLTRQGIIDVHLGFVESASEMRRIVNSPGEETKDKVAAAKWIKEATEMISTLEQQTPRLPSSTIDTASSDDPEAILAAFRQRDARKPST